MYQSMNSNRLTAPTSGKHIVRSARRRTVSICLFAISVSLLPYSASAQERDPVIVSDEARRIHAASFLVDGHNDLPWALRQLGPPSFKTFDIAKSQPKLHTDIPRLREGGVKAQFWSVYVPASIRLRGESLQTTIEQIELVHRMVDHYPATFAFCRTTADIEQAEKDGKIASMIGVEGGHSIENSISVLRQLYELGARYMTLTHSDTLEWADSATDEAKHGGLSEFGEEVVREMNRLGMLVDLSHVSDETMRDALRVTKAPVIYSHSSARALAHHPRNVPDDMLPLVKKNRGVIMVNFYPEFVSSAAVARRSERDEQQEKFEKEYSEQSERNAAMAKWEREHPVPPCDIYDVVDHIEHLIKKCGIDHVGIGSDYDGIDRVPKQLEDVSTYPRITQEMLNRGYSANDIHKLMGKNVMRVFRETERVASAIQD